ncbi:MAG: RidA family protein [Gammaproteobacteria bacterium]|nr:RidA family protein [Gammaproteobacteria bacterium]
MQRKIVNPWKWQDKYGFVQANEISGAGRVVYCSGQVAADADGKPLHPGDMQAQLNRALDNVTTVLKGAGLGLSDVVRLNYYTTDVAAFVKAGPALAERLNRERCRSASTLLGVASLYHPDVLVEIEATAAA